MSRIVTKPTKWHVRPAKTQISLDIRPVWSESSLSAWRKLGSLAIHWAHSEDYIVGWTYIVGFTDTYIFLWPIMACQTLHYSMFLYFYRILLHYYCIFWDLYLISGHFYSICFVSILYSMICIQYIRLFLLYNFRLYCIFSHLHCIFLDLYLISGHFYSILLHYYCIFLDLYLISGHFYYI